MCDQSVRLEGFYLVFVFMIAQGFLTARYVWPSDPVIASNHDLAR